jgi:glycosyltransferase involved in cell wall biosynthesis
MGDHGRNMKSNSQMIRGLVSTIIPVYNRPALLTRAVGSVLHQSYRPIEIIIVDDGSTDDTGAVAANLAHQHMNEIRVVYQENAGPGVARETGRGMARGEFIQYLDSDDVLLPEKFECQVKGLREHDECGVSYGKLRHHQLPSTVSWKRTGEKIETMFPFFLKEHWWSFPAPLYRREVSDLAGPWTDLRQEEDWEYDCRIAAYGIRLHYCDKFVGEKGVGDRSNLSTRWSVEPEYMKDRVTAHELIFEHARKAAISIDSAEMQHFARELFLMARQCGNAGLAEEAKKMFGLSRRAAGGIRSKGFDYRIYRIIAYIFGWTNAGKITCALDRLRTSR